MTELGGVKQAGDIRAVIFDMDGVLTNSEPLINTAAIAMFKEKGLIVQPEDFLPFVGTGEDRYIGGVAERYHFELDLPAAKARTYEIYLELVPKQLEAFPGAKELVQACLAGGLRVAVASSADRIKIEANLRKIGLPPECWNALVWGEEVVNKKPAADIFLAAAAKLGLEPGQCTVIEDAVSGVQAAKAAGMRCVAVAQTFPAERLQGAEVVRASILEVTIADLVGQARVNGQAKTAGGIAPAAIPPPIPEVSLETGMRSSRPWGFWATVGLALSIFIAEIMVQGVAVFVWAIALKGKRTGALSAADVESNGLVLAAVTCASVPVVVGLTYLFASIRVGREAAHYLGFRRFRWQALLRWGIAMLCFIVASDALTKSLGRPIVPPFMEDAYRTAGFLPLFWLALVVAAPLAEESLFRGFLFEGVLHSRLGAAGAIVLSALGWASIHLQYDLYGVATIFVTGLLLGYVRLKTGSVYVTMLLHGLMNLVATLEVAVLRGRI